MKKIIVIIRNEKVEETKKALKDLGVKGITFLNVSGRGMPEELGLARSPRDERPSTFMTDDERQDGLPVSRGVDRALSPRIKPRIPGFQPQRMLIIVTNDGSVPIIVDTLIAANQTGRHGDGKIFVCPMISAIRVRNGEAGDNALT